MLNDKIKNKILKNLHKLLDTIYRLPSNTSDDKQYNYTKVLQTINDINSDKLGANTIKSKLDEMNTLWIEVCDVQKFWHRIDVFLNEGSKIEAIKLYRTNFKASLRESKEAVDEYQKNRLSL